MNPSSYTVVIPALNEADGISAVLDRIMTLTPKPEVIVVDDGSTDETARIARSKGARLVSHPTPGGYGRSLKDGIRAATHEIIVITDADGTYPIERIPDLLASLAKGFDMAVGARTGPEYRGTFLKMPARILLKWLVEFTTGRHIPDINSGLRAFRKADALRYVDDLCNGFSFTTTITLIYLLSGKFVEYLPIAYASRVGRSKVRIIRDSLRTLQYITEVIAVYNPLKLFVLLSGFLLLLALLIIGGAHVFLDPTFLPFTLLLATFFFIGAVVLFGMGVHAHIAARERRSA